MNRTTTERREQHARSGGIAAAALAMLVLCLGNGCVLPVPVNYHAHRTRKNVRPADLQWLAPGVTTRHDALLRLGEPDTLAADDSHITYCWKKVHLQVWYAVGGGYQGDAGRVEFGPDYALELAFDEEGRLLNAHIQKSKWRTQGGVSFTDPQTW